MTTPTTDDPTSAEALLDALAAAVALPITDDEIDAGRAAGLRGIGAILHWAKARRCAADVATWLRANSDLADVAIVGFEAGSPAAISCAAMRAGLAALADAIEAEVSRG